ncbi:MAG: recombination mediator RecR [Clostridiales Family XIII bacterium]|nr:recombination mediator RecR [Clostridiales Family XIII bacterium]
MQSYPEALANLVSELAKLPGVGLKTAQRLAFHILSMKDDEAISIANAIVNAKKDLKFCSVCGNLTDVDPCAICEDPSRDRTIFCVVESPKDVVAIERMREYKGLYHVLHGVIAPMAGVGPEDINLESLIHRLAGSDEAAEVIIATNPNIEGEATAMYIARLIKPAGIKVTRIAYGVSIGGDIEYTDDITLAKAIEGRREI